VLVEILGVDRPESVQAYRQRVIELDPYSAQVTGSIFLSDEVPDAAVTLEHLDWNGQAVGMEADWEARQAISLESGQRQEEQPDWLKNSFTESSSPFASQPTSVPTFDAAPPSAQPVEPVAEIPDFLRDAGWGKSTGAFDESKSAFAESEPSPAEQPIEQGDLPDWIKAMAPPPAEPAAEEELPDWINKIGTNELPVSSEPSEPDWLKQVGESEQPAAIEDQPDWLKGFGSEAESTEAAPSKGELDWLSELGQESGAQSIEDSSKEFDFLKPQVGQLDATPSTPAVIPPGFLEEQEPQPESTPAVAADNFDFLNELAEETEQLAPSSVPEASMPAPATTDTLGMSNEEQDDSFAWLESLAAKQGATEGLLTKPEERLEEEPDWVKQAKGMNISQPPAPAGPPAVAQPTGNIEELGKSEQEQEDSFAWLESLAAKQGATEGLLTKPEERLEEEPEWVQQAKSVADQPQAQEASPPVQPPEEEKPPVIEPTATLEDLGKSEQEREDAFAWLESLAAKQGASEGLLTKPEERLEEEPDWVKHAKDVSAQQPPMAAPVSEQPAQPASVEDTAAWLRSLDEEETTSTAQPQERLEETPDWLKQTEAAPAEEAPAPTPIMEKPSAIDDTAAWLKSLEEEETSVLHSQERLEQTSDWLKETEVKPAEEPATPTPIKEQPSAIDDTAAWLQSLDEEEKEMATPEPSSIDNTAMWLKSLDEAAPVTEKPAESPAETLAEAGQAEDLPAWMQDIEREAPAVEPGLPQREMAEEPEQVRAFEQEAPTPSTVSAEEEEIPSWLSELDKEPEQAVTPTAMDSDLPSWLRDETGELVAEPTKIEPTRMTDWQPIETKEPEPKPEPIVPEPVIAPPQPEPVNVVEIIEEKLAAVQEQEQPAPPPAPAKKPVERKGTGKLTMPFDPVLGQARNELSRSNISGALEGYDRLIKKGRFLEEVIYDLRDALYRYPVDVGIWQSLGDAYMRANRLQDALDAYTKAEELLR
jgi:hypothetical protein